MKDAKSNIHLRPYALYSLMAAIVCTAGVLLYTMLPRGSTVQSLAILETSGLWLVLSLTALAGASAHDARKVSKPTEILGLSTFVLAIITLVTQIVRLTMYLQDSATYAVTSLIAIALTILCIAAAIISSVLPSIIKKTSTIVFSLAVGVCITTTLAVVSGIIALFNDVVVFELIAISSLIITIMCLILLPVVRHTLYVHKHIKSA